MPRCLVPLALAVLAVALTACQAKTPLGPERAAYAGVWSGADGSVVELFGDGSGNYRSGGTKVSGAAARFEGQTLSIKFAGIGRSFTVTKAPHPAGGRMVMVLDGIAYTRQ